MTIHLEDERLYSLLCLSIFASCLYPLHDKCLYTWGLCTVRVKTLIIYTLSDIHNWNTEVMSYIITKDVSSSSEIPFTSWLLIGHTPFAPPFCFTGDSLAAWSLFDDPFKMSAVKKIGKGYIIGREYSTEKQMLHSYFHILSLFWSFQL